MVLVRPWLRFEFYVRSTNESTHLVMNHPKRSSLFHRHSDEHDHVGPNPALNPQRSEVHTTSSAAVFLDMPSGAGGDMIVAALCDLGVPWNVVTSAVAALGIEGVELALVPVQIGAIAALRFCVHVDEALQSERSYEQIRDLLTTAALSPGTKAMSLAVFERLAKAEAKVHRTAVEAVHFHEVGAVDSLCDVVAACAALDHLSARLSSSPLPLGRGFVDCRHGRLPLPAPATIECLVGLQTYPVELEVELVTPTAAAFLGALSVACVPWPKGTMRASGWGAGTRVLADRPNVLRAVLYEPDRSFAIAGG